MPNHKREMWRGAEMIKCTSHKNKRNKKFRAIQKKTKLFSSPSSALGDVWVMRKFLSSSKVHFMQPLHKQPHNSRAIIDWQAIRWVAYRRPANDESNFPIWVINCLISDDIYRTNQGLRYTERRMQFWDMHAMSCWSSNGVGFRRCRFWWREFDHERFGSRSIDSIEKSSNLVLNLVLNLVRIKLDSFSNWVRI